MCTLSRHRGQEAPAGNISWFKDVIQISTPSPVLLAPGRVPRICGLYCHFLHLRTASFASCFLSISHGIWHPTVTRNERVSFLIHLLLFMFSSDQKSPVRSLSHSRFHVHFWDFLSFIQRGSLNMTKMGLISTVIGHECTLYQIFPWLQFVTDWLTCVTYKPSLKYLSLKKYFTWFQKQTWKKLHQIQYTPTKWILTSVVATPLFCWYFPEKKNSFPWNDVKLLKENRYEIYRY